MKNIPQFVMELAITIIVALLLSGAVALLAGFVTGNTGTFYQSLPAINFASSAIFGLVVGYKLNSLIRQHKR